MVLGLADVLRADGREARLLTGAEDRAGLRAAARDLLDVGPGLVAPGLPDGNLFVWRDPRWGAGELVLPLTAEEVADTTGAGDAFTVAVTAALPRGVPVEEAAKRAVRAAGLTVGHPGGRPDLSSLAGGPD